ncbi:hypothetical protein KEH51_07285 [[Brevibacterium] frigoritolerans]|uniref:Uncharacterized protein n=1 Tax=Peribacillus frigoritolerans TaxID=450367 RepID=A0A941FQT3_9BACI|nr:hypothetical protein [Peribacillus frigoritolerans]
MVPDSRRNAKRRRFQGRDSFAGKFIDFYQGAGGLAASIIIFVIGGAGLATTVITRKTAA